MSGTNEMEEAVSKASSGVDEEEENVWQPLLLSASTRAGSSMRGAGGGGHQHLIEADPSPMQLRRRSTAAAELLKMGGRNRSIRLPAPPHLHYDEGDSIGGGERPRPSDSESLRPHPLKAKSSSGAEGYGTGNSKRDRDISLHEYPQKKEVDRNSHLPTSYQNKRTSNGMTSGISVASKEPIDWDFVMTQVPAVILACALTLMISVPFGSAYFPVEWKAQELSGPDESGGDADGVFPVPGKDSLGIRMLIFSSVICQIVLAYTSGFKQAIGLQMVENVPFLHTFASIVIADQGYGIETLSTLFFVFGATSVAVGIVFFCLGYFELGKVVYFFPRHVLVGCIGGIGIFIIEVALEVSTNEPFSFSRAGFEGLFYNFNLLAVVLAFEICLRVLTRLTTDECGNHRFPLLGPCFYILITPIFYLGMWVTRVSFDDAADAGYFFPRPASSESPESGILSILGADSFQMWQLMNLSTISWSAVNKCLPTMVSCIVFSLMHVPINVPALAISVGEDVDMNRELKAHGYSNFLVGLFGGLQNYLCYSNSVVYAKVGGEGRTSSLIIAFITAILFFVGPSVATYIPRCMAGTLLLHVGTDLFLEGVYDSYEMFDLLEYSGIWLVTIVMAGWGMTAGIIAGAITALTTYAVQSVTYQNPIRGHMTATTLRSGKWNRPAAANAILDDRRNGRKRILIIQLQGHLFFGTVAQLTDEVAAILKQKQEEGDEVWIVILDFTLVLGIDSSAAQGIAKIKDMMHRQHDIAFAIYVTGSKEGFPCECNLSEDLRSPCEKTTNEHHHHLHDSYLAAPVFSVNTADYDHAFPSLPADHVCHSLESALEFAEDVLVARRSPVLLLDVDGDGVEGSSATSGKAETAGEEADLLMKHLRNLCPGEDEANLVHLSSLLEREEYREGDIVWKQGSKSDSAKVVVKGTCIALLEDEADTTEDVPTGVMVGELGLVRGVYRLSTVRCNSEAAVLYSLSKAKWQALLEEKPAVARCIDLIVIKYLEHRVQHVSNRIFETRCLPI